MVFIMMFLIHVTLLLELFKELLLILVPTSWIFLRCHPIVTHLKKSRSDFRPEFCKAPLRPVASATARHLKEFPVIVKFHDSLDPIRQTTLDTSIDHVENRVRVCNLDLLKQTLVGSNLRHEFHEVDGGI